MSEQIVSMEKISLSALDAYAARAHTPCPYPLGSVAAEWWQIELASFAAFDCMLAGEPWVAPTIPGTEPLAAVSQDGYQ